MWRCGLDIVQELYAEGRVAPYSGRRLGVDCELAEADGLSCLEIVWSQKSSCKRGQSARLLIMVEPALALGIGPPVGGLDWQVTEAPSQAYQGSDTYDAPQRHSTSPRPVDARK